MSKVHISITHKPAAPDSIIFPEKLLIIKRNPNRDTGLKNSPDEIPLKGDSWSVATLGPGIPITPETWEFMEDTNSKEGFDYICTSQAMWLNLSGDTPRKIDIYTEKVVAESIASGGALAAWDKFENGRYRLLSWNYKDAIDPAIHNPEREPWRFWTPTSVDKAGNIYLVGKAVVAHIPFLNYTGEIWIGEDEVILVTDPITKWDITDVMTKRKTV